MKDDPKVVRAGPWGGLAWRAVLEMTKALDWGGVIPAGQVDGRLLARHFGWTGDELMGVVETSPVSGTDRDEAPVARVLQEGFEACVRVGLLVPLEGGDLGIPNWPDYQPDPTSARRVRKHRARRKLLEAQRKGSGGVTVTGRGNGDGTGRDERPSLEATATAEAEASRGKGPAPASKKRRDLRTPVERLLGERGITLSDRGGCSVTAWRKQLRAAEKAGAPDQEVADAIAASSPLDKPWDALQPVTNRYGKASRRDSRGFRIPAGAPKPPPGESFGEGTRARNDEGPQEDI